MPPKAKKKGGAIPDHVQTQPEEPLPPAQEMTDEEFLQKYTGENSQAIWFRNIIRAQAKHVMEETIAQEVEKSTTNINIQLKKLQEEMAEKTKELENKISKLHRALDGVNKDLGRKNDEIQLLKAHIDTIEQKQKETRVRIMGIDEESNENLHKKIVKIAKSKLAMKKLKEDDIQEVYRAGKKKENKTRDIVVQFTKKSTRDEFLKQRTKIPRTTDPRKRMYINEDLTEFRQKLLFDARQKVKCGKIKDAWCQHGNIMVLKLEGGPTCIKDYNDLRALTRSGVQIQSAGGHDDNDEGTSGTTSDIISDFSITDYDSY